MVDLFRMDNICVGQFRFIIERHCIVFIIFFSFIIILSQLIFEYFRFSSADFFLLYLRYCIWVDLYYRSCMISRIIYKPAKYTSYYAEYMCGVRQKYKCTYVSALRNTIMQPTRHKTYTLSIIHIQYEWEWGIKYINRVSRRFPLNHNLL